MKNKSYLISLFTLVVAVLITLLPSVHADLGSYKQGSCINIKVLNNCSSNILVEISNNNQTFLINKTMTNLGGQTFNYSFCNTSYIDKYTYSWSPNCYDCSNADCGNSFTITATGQLLTIEKSITYILIFVISLLIFIGLLMIGIFLPVSNKTDEMTGYVLAVSNVKYLKFLCIGLSYIVLIFLSYFTWQTSYAYLDFLFLTSIFQWIFYVLSICTLPFFILIVYIMIANAVRDSHISDLLSRGLHAK